MKKKIFRVSFDLDVTKGIDEAMADKGDGLTEEEVEELITAARITFPFVIKKTIKQKFEGENQKVENFNCEYIKVDK